MYVRTTCRGARPETNSAHDIFLVPNKIDDSGTGLQKVVDAHEKMLKTKADNSLSMMKGGASIRKFDMECAIDAKLISKGFNVDSGMLDTSKKAWITAHKSWTWNLGFVAWPFPGLP